MVKIWPSNRLGQIELKDYCTNRLSFLSLLQLIHIVKTENSNMLTSESGFLSGLESWAIEHLLWWNWSCEKTCFVSLAMEIPFLGKLELWENLSRRNIPLTSFFCILSTTCRWQPAANFCVTFICLFPVFFAETENVTRAYLKRQRKPFQSEDVI